MLLTHLQRGWRCGVFAAARVVWIFCEKLNFRQKNAQIHVFFYQVAVLADRISPTEASASKQRPRQWLGVASCAFHNSWHYCVPPFNRWPITTPTALHKKNNEHVCIINVGVSIAIRVGHADVSADAHQMCIDAHWCASSAYWTKRIFPFLTHKLPFWLHFSKSLGSEPQLTNINYVEYVEVSSFCVNEAREFIQLYISGATPPYQGSNWTSLRIIEIW